MQHRTGEYEGSLSARRAWIEIYLPVLFYKKRIVALRKESVDRNYYCDHDTDWIRAVALRKESVDRNECSKLLVMLILVSLSARRAWIEIVCEMRCFFMSAVALRKESVDRNLLTLIIGFLERVSLSARRAWIEIINNNYNDLTRPCRSPQGERG